MAVELLGAVSAAPSGQSSAEIAHPLLSAVFLASQSLLLNVLGLFATAFIIRRLGPLEYGQWAAASSLASAYLIVTNLGLRPLFIRDGARRPTNIDQVLAEQLGLRLALGALASAAAVTTSVLLGYPAVVIACMAVGCAWIILTVVYSTLGDLLQSLERFGTYSSIALLAGLVVTASSLLVVYLGYGPIGLSVAYLSAPLVGSVFYWRAVRRHTRIGLSFSWSRSIALLTSSRFIGLSQLAATVRDRAEHLLVPKMVGFEAFGIFSAGTIVADRLGYIPDAISTAFYPRITAATAGRVQDASTALVLNMLTIGIASSLPLAIVGTFLAPSLADLLLPDSTELAAILRVAIWTVPLMALSLGMSYAIQAAGDHHVVARSALMATALSTPTSIVLISGFGVLGASWSFLLRPGLLALLMLPAFGRTFPGVLGRVPYARLAISTGFLAPVLLFDATHGLVAAAGIATAGLAIYAISLVASKVLILPRHRALIAPGR